MIHLIVHFIGETVRLATKLDQRRFNLSVSPSTFDLVVLGSGAAGLSAAVTAAQAGLKVAVFEKHKHVGGTSAWSGGHVWIPNNSLMSAAGASDSEEEAVTYLMSMSRGVMEEDLVRSFVQAGPEMVDFFNEIAQTEFSVSVGIPDYHPEHPGAKSEGGRTLETPLFPFGELGEWSERIAVSPYYANPHVVMRETPTGQAVPVEVSEEELARRAAHNERGLGQSLIGRLLKAALDRGVTVETSARGVELLQRDGRVTGVTIEETQGRRDVFATRGVVLATGGFEWNEQYRKAFLRGPLSHPISIRSNEGDGLTMAMQLGAQLSNMGEAFWTTAADLPEGINSENRIMLSGDRARPRAIMVNAHGERFANESANYNAFGGAFHQEDVNAFEYRNLPCWLIFDEEYLRRYGTVRTPAGEPAPAWITRANSLAALAAKIGVDADGLEATVKRWNQNVAEGHDPDFHRGESAHDKWWGDPARKGTIEASLGPLDTAPFYAIQVHVGAMGTKGGPRINGNAQVLGREGDPILGLYAAGNAMGAPYGKTYGGAGGTLGPALVAGYLAARHAAATA